MNSPAELESARQTSRRQRACTECYQRKVKCEWHENLDACVRCRMKALTCRMPSPSQVPLRNPVRDVIGFLDRRLRNIEASDTNSRNPLEGGGGQPVPKPPRSQLDQSTVLGSAAITSTVEAGQAPLMPSLPWRMLASRTATSCVLLEQEGSLVKEDAVLHAPSHALAYDFRQDFPLLTGEDIIRMAREFAFEAPFLFTHWPTLMAEISVLIDQHVSKTAAHLACILMHLSFGASRLPQVAGIYSPEVFFQKALTFLPLLILQQDVTALKAITLMVHYQQASSQPAQSYTFLGMASHLALSLGIHRMQDPATMSSRIEHQEALRAWWLCYITQRTLKVIYNLPAVEPSIAAETLLPEQFHITEAVTTGEIEAEQATLEDSEAVGLYRDIIAVARVRDSILEAPKGTTGTDLHSLSSWREELDNARYSKGYTSSIRGSISQLHYWNTIIILNHHLADLSNETQEALNAAVKTIQLIEASQGDGVTMCLWMWLYYAFAAAVVVFSAAVRQPLGSNATYYLALISDIHGICSHFAPYSPGARRVEIVTQRMDDVGFKLIKALSKKRAAEGDGESAHLAKTNRAENAFTESSRQAAEFESLPGSWGTGSGDDFGLANLVQEPPTNFVWEDWETWFDASANFDT